MDGHSCDLECAPAVASDDTSSLVTGSCTDIPPGKQSVAADSSSEAGICAGFSKSVGSGLKKDLQKCATFPASAAEAEQEDSCCDGDAPKDAHTYQRSVSLPPTVKLISAIKGSRQKNGIPLPNEDRHIKWAADVYDPPVSSVSHSVNNSYQRRPKPRKKDKTKREREAKGQVQEKG